ncbi:hypothetical protein PM082_016202 [Marasmius tenuissimus]|nr:hypothetical protein PM082_016202 [Marasmius tenuissimus]
MASKANSADTVSENTTQSSGDILTVNKLKTSKLDNLSVREVKEQVSKSPGKEDKSPAG